MGKAHSKELYNSYSGTFRVNTSGRIRKAGHVALHRWDGKGKVCYVKDMNNKYNHNFSCITSKDNIEERWVIQI
jgi:hypothetical protein